MNAVRLALIKAALVALVGLAGTALSGCEESTVPAAPTVTIPTPEAQPYAESVGTAAHPIAVPAGAASTNSAVR